MINMVFICGACHYGVPMTPGDVIAAALIGTSLRKSKQKLKTHRLNSSSISNPTVYHETLMHDLSYIRRNTAIYFYGNDYRREGL